MCKKRFRRLVVALAVCAASLGFSTTTWAHPTDIRYVNHSGGYVILEAQIAPTDNDPNWQLDSTCLRNAIPHGGSCDLVARYNGLTAGRHDALVTLHFINQQRHMTTRKVMVHATIIGTAQPLQSGGHQNA